MSDRSAHDDYQPSHQNQRMVEGSDPVGDLLAGAANILFLASPIALSTDQACTRLLEGGTMPPDRCLWITFTRSPDHKLDLLGGDSAASRAKRGVIAVGSQTRSTTTGGNAIPPEPASPVIRTVAEPTDLTGLGIMVSKFLEAWDDDDGQFTLCFDSITPLLVYASVEKAYRFLHVLTARIDALGATAHYHIDPNAHPAETVSRLIPLFDAVIECTDNGKLTPVNS